MTMLFIVMVLMSGCGQKNLEEKKEQSGKVETVKKTEEMPAVLELGNLDSIPVNFQDKGWIIQQEGKYGFVDANGKMVVEPKYENANLTMRSGQDDQLDMAYLYHETLDPNEDALLPDDHVPNPNAAYGVGGITPSNAAFLSQNNEIVYFDVFAQKQVDDLTVPVEKPATVYPLGTEKESKAKSDYYVLDPVANTISDAIASDLKLSYLQTLMDKTWGHYNIPVGWTFWLPEKESATLVDAKNGQVISGFDSAMPVDLTTILGIKDGQCFVFDQNLDLLYGGDIEAGATPLNDLVPVQTDGEWKIVAVDDVNPKETPEFKKEKRTLFSPVTVSESKPVMSAQAGIYSLHHIMNVRTDASKTAPVLEQKQAGELVQVLETQSSSDGSIWGKLWEGRWICLGEDGQEYGTPVNSTTLTFEQLQPLIIAHYTYLNEPDGTYSITDVRTEGSTTSCVLRYAMSDEAAKQRMAEGLPVTANVMVAMIQVDRNTGVITDDQNWDTWRYQ